MPAPVVVTGLTATVTITDGQGNTIGTSDNPLQVDSAALRESVGEIVEELKDFKETVKLIAT